ncbi:MAG: hypothetical protein KKA05_01425 [Alphaproteobacteria bacterium]|nr:hypothetical protein [Alphaproteobacteria bacterium]
MDFSTGLAVGIAVADSFDHDAKRAAEAQKFREQENSSIAKVLLSNPAFEHAVRQTIDQLNEKLSAPETFVNGDNIIPTTRTGFLGLFKTAATGAEAETLKAQACRILAFNQTGQDLTQKAIHNVARSAAAAAKYQSGHSAEFVAGLDNDDFTKIGKLGTIRHVYRAMTRYGSSDDRALKLINGADEKPADFNQGLLVSTVRQYATAIGEGLSTYYKQQAAAVTVSQTDASPSTANDNPAATIARKPGPAPQ